jgi:hypothetical protein
MLSDAVRRVLWNDDDAFYYVPYLHLIRFFLCCRLLELVALLARSFFNLQENEGDEEDERDEEDELKILEIA